MEEEKLIIDEKEIKKRKKKKKNKINKWFYTFVVLDILAVLGLFVVYGPWDGFRNLWITSAMTTMSHHYLANTFYSEDTINKTISMNYVEDIDEATNVDAISFSNTDTGVYESEYEEQILKRNEGNDLYKVFDVKVNGSTAHIAVIYDPSRIHYTVSSRITRGGQRLFELAKEQEAIVAVNASGFARRGVKLIPNGVTIMDGKVLQNGKIDSKQQGIIGFNNDNVLVLIKGDADDAIKAGLRDAMTFGPFLYVNGAPAKISGNGGGGCHPRTVIAQRKDGIVFFIVFDRRDYIKGELGATFSDLVQVLTRYKAYNAANLDGGGSSTLIVENKFGNKPGAADYPQGRYLPDAWIIK